MHIQILHYIFLCVATRKNSPCQQTKCLKNQIQSTCALFSESLERQYNGSQCSDSDVSSKDCFMWFCVPKAKWQSELLSANPEVDCSRLYHELTVYAA